MGQGEEGFLIGLTPPSPTGPLPSSPIFDHRNPPGPPETFSCISGERIGPRKEGKGGRGEGGQSVTRGKGGGGNGEAAKNGGGEVQGVKLVWCQSYVYGGKNVLSIIAIRYCPFVTI